MKANLIKIISVLAVFLTAGTTCLGTEVAKDTLTAAEVFVNLPLKTLDILNRSTRMDMVDYYQEADSIYKAMNGMEGFSELKKLTKNYLDVSITPVTRMEIIILDPLPKKGPVAAVLYTVGGDGQAADTDMTFLDRNMKELPRKKYLEYPDITEFFDLADGKEKKEIEELVPFPTIEFTTIDETSSLKARLTVGEFMGKENYDKIKKYMKPGLSYRWNGKKYELIR